MNEKMKQILNDEETLRFESFSNADALRLGNIIINLAKNRFEKGISLQIEVKDMILFSYFMEGTTARNQYWMHAKKNVVHHYGNSSHYVHEMFAEKGLDFHEASHLPSSDYQAEGGSFPLVVNKEGLVGTITVSGLTSEADHDLVVEGIKCFLSTDRIQHMVVFNLCHEPDSLQAKQFLQDGYNQLTQIPTVEEFQVLSQVSVKCGFMYGFSMFFNNKAAYDFYNLHPLHVDFVENRWLKEVVDFQEIDLTVKSVI